MKALEAQRGPAGPTCGALVAEGYFQKNPFEAYSLSNIVAKKGADGSIAVQFGGCDGKISNCLPIMKDWNYTGRLYRPRAEVSSGTGKISRFIES